jgi:hypothetical protein
MNQITAHFLIVVLFNTLLSNGQTNNICSNNEELAVLEIQLDQNANETGYKLVCDGITIWDVPIGSLKDQPAGAWKREQSCIRSDTIMCNFTISDEGRDGITGGDAGFFSLFFGATTVAYLNYGKVAPFHEHSYCFGTSCDVPMIEEREDDEITDGWKMIEFNETIAPTSDGESPEEDGPNFDTAGVWVVNVTKIMNNDTDNDSNEDEKWVVNVTVIKREDDPVVDPDDIPAPNDDNAVPNQNDIVIRTSDSNSRSTSSLTIIVCVIGSVVMGMLVLFILYKRGHRSHDTTHDTVGAVLPYAQNLNNDKNTNIGTNKYDDDKDDDEKSKNSNHNDKVLPAETFVTLESHDSTVLQVA